MTPLVKQTIAATFLLLAVSLQACKPVEKAVEETTVETTEETVVVDHGSAPSTSERLIGTVRNTEECGYIINVIQGDVMKSYYPVNLDDLYKKDGLKIKFAWEKKPTQQTANCSYLISVTISDVTPMR